MIAYFQFLGRTAFSALRLISALDDDTTQVRKLTKTNQTPIVNLPKSSQSGNLYPSSAIKE
jgi:hypothetical protein